MGSPFSLRFTIAQEVNLKASPGRRGFNPIIQTIKTVPLGGRMITIENLTPILPPKERERRKRDIEKRLFDVFSKYAENPRK